MEHPSQVVYHPICEKELKPYVGQKFSSIVEAREFYDNYARLVGFDTRKHGSKSTDDVTTWLYIVCSREGKKRSESSDAVNAREGFVNRRRRASKRCDCNARISFKFVHEDGQISYIVNQFVEEHNHLMVEESHKRFMNLNRKLDEVHKKFIFDCANANIGPTMTFKLLNELLGGYDGVGCTVLEVRNYNRDMKAYIEGSDAEMLLLVMRRKKESSDGFFYEYEVDSEDKIKRIFWADAVARRNFNMFGDSVAFDTTYNTNRYCMIFAPFTGKDNHGSPVTFAAGLITKEDADSFSWLFRQFIKCMGAAPKLIITDQDLGMKAAIERVFKGTRHRWCMWHIMLKLADKVPKSLLANDQFKKDLNSSVWSESIEVEQFEQSWNDTMEQYGLQNDEWFKSMYGWRQYWIPAFFRDVSMGSLLRTTSVSESENSFFKKYTKHRSNLLEFILNFNQALEAQRNQNARLNYKDTTVAPILATELPIEKHASILYTDTKFKEVQAEIVEACFHCRVLQLNIENNVEKYQVTDGSRNSLTVSVDPEKELYLCQCKLYGRLGILCRHIFFVLKNKDIKLIPEKYYGGRWLKSSLLKAVHTEFDEATPRSYSGDKRDALNKLYSTFFGLVHRIENNYDQIHALTDGINDVGIQLFGDPNVIPPVEKKRLIESYYGMAKPDVISVHPPNVVKTKGSGSRLISRKEKAIRILNKPARRCAKCGEMGHHDSRNCDKMKEKNKGKELIKE